MVHCKTCERTGAEAIDVPGSGFVEVILWMLAAASLLYFGFNFVGILIATLIAIAAIVYAQWRKRSITVTCGSCGSEDIIAADSPAYRNGAKYNRRYTPVLGLNDPR